MVIEKLDSGAANLFNNEGRICFLSSNDRNDIICFATKQDKPAIMWSLADVSDEAEPGIQVSADGKLQYRNKAGSWADFDSLQSSFEIADGSITSSKLDAAFGTSGQVLSLTSNGALQWVTPEAVVIDDNVITSSKIADDTIVDADMNASAAIAGTKIAPDFGNQLVSTYNFLSSERLYTKRMITVGKKGESNLLPTTRGELHLYWGTNVFEDSPINPEPGYVGLRVSNVGRDRDNPMKARETYYLNLPSRGGVKGQILQLSDDDDNLSWVDLDKVTEYDSIPNSELDYLSPGYYPTGGYHKKDCTGLSFTTSFMVVRTKDGQEYGLCVEKQQRGPATWGDAYATCGSEGKRLLHFNEWRKACDGEGPSSNTDWGGAQYDRAPTNFDWPQNPEWASYPHPVHYVDIDPTMRVATEISGVGALIGFLQQEDQDTLNGEMTHLQDLGSCAYVKTVQLRWTETIRSPLTSIEPTVTPRPTTDQEFKAMTGKGPDKLVPLSEPQYHFRCAY